MFAKIGATVVSLRPRIYGREVKVVVCGARKNWVKLQLFSNDFLSLDIMW